MDGTRKPPPLPTCGLCQDERRVYYPGEGWDVCPACVVLGPSITRPRLRTPEEANLSDRCTPES